MKRHFIILLAVLLCAGGLMPATARADDPYDHSRPHMVWVPRHFVWVHGHRVFWVPGHPGVR